MKDTHPMVMAPGRAMPAQHLPPPLQWQATTRRLQVTYVLGLVGAQCEREAPYWRSVAVISLAAALLLTLAGCERWALDRKMEELCRKDGGVKVYETVILPAREFESAVNRWGALWRSLSRKRTTLGRTTAMCSKREILIGPRANAERGEGQLITLYNAIYRRTDGRLLGEQIGTPEVAVMASPSVLNLAASHVPISLAISHRRSSSEES